MTDDPDLPRLWTHEPHVHLQFRAGRQGRRHRHRRHPGVPRLQVRRSCAAGRAQQPLRRTAGDALRQQRSGDNRSVLLVLQGMDTAGKGGIVKHVVGAGNPQGIRYTSFGKPTEEELAHHYLWRIRNALPPAGHIGVFDRSHYEDVLIVRVHNLVPPDVWGARYDEINAFERELVDGGTTLVKVAMFVSLESRRSGWPDASTGRTSTGSTTRPTSMSANCGRSTPRPIRRCWTAPRRITPRGTSCRATGSGTADLRSPNCSSRR